MVCSPEFFSLVYLKKTVAAQNSFLTPYIIPSTPAHKEDREMKIFEIVFLHTIWFKKRIIVSCVSAPKLFRVLSD